MAVLQDLTQAELIALVQKLQSNGSKGLKVSEKGAVSLYGIRRFPVTYYKTEWLSILDKADAIRQFLIDHDSELSVKGE